jgi:C4-type Zn-finger protein
MVRITCPKCKSEIEIDEYKKDGINSIGVFCRDEECFYHDHPIIGLDLKEPGAYITEAILQKNIGV